MNMLNPNPELPDVSELMTKLFSGSKGTSKAGSSSSSSSKGTRSAVKRRQYLTGQTGLQSPCRCTSYAVKARLLCVLGLLYSFLHVQMLSAHLGLAVLLMITGQRYNVPIHPSILPALKPLQLCKRSNASFSLFFVPVALMLIKLPTSLSCANPPVVCILFPLLLIPLPEREHLHTQRFLFSVI